MTAKKTIWIIEDELDCQFIYTEVLELRYDLKFFKSIKEIKKHIVDSDDNKKPDLLIADIRLPEESFLSFLESDFKHFLNNVTFIVVSSLDDLDALRICFEKGCSDYITKPFGKCELIVKVERLLSESKVEPSDYDEVIVNKEKFSISFMDKESTPLTMKEFQIFNTLMLAEDKTIKRKELLKKVWGDVTVTSKTLDVHMFNLRKKLAPVDISIQFIMPDLFRLITHPN